MLEGMERTTAEVKVVNECVGGNSLRAHRPPQRRVCYLAVHVSKKSRIESLSP